MPILPLAAAIAVFVDGRNVAAYAPAYVVAGRTYAPIDPYVTQVADRLEYEGRTLVISRGERRAVLPLRQVAPDALDRQYVALAATLRDLGAAVTYDAREHRVEVRLPAPSPIVSPPPFDPLALQAAPHVVFTPQPSPAPRVIWRGPAVPRRTPLPVPIPT
ncbi:MAG: hypothetical protein ACREMP_03590 [Candidatus Tyrphobacter sp.]